MQNNNINNELKQIKLLLEVILISLQKKGSTSITFPNTRRIGARVRTIPRRVV